MTGAAESKGGASDVDSEAVGATVGGGIRTSAVGGSGTSTVGGVATVACGPSSGTWLWVGEGTQGEGSH